MQLSDSNLELVRTHPQSSELYLSIFRPTTVLTASVSGTLSSGEMSIPYTSVTTGSYTNIESGMTLLVGSPTDDDKFGRIRVKSATATHINVAENSHINWASASRLKVLKYWELWPVYPRIIPDPADDENVIFYKDYDIAYTNQNSVLGAFPCAGTHRAAFVGDNLFFTSSGTSHLEGSGITHSWAFEGGTPTGSTAGQPGNVVWNTPGHYVVRYKVTGNNGSEDTTYRYVSIYNNPATSNSNVPVRKWELSNLSGSRGEGGYTASIRVIDEIMSDIGGGDVIVIWSDDWYGGTNTSLGGNSKNNSKIFFVGHIVDASIQYNYKQSTTEFQVASISDIMKKVEAFSVSVESKVSPSKWFELQNMNGKRALYHYLKWHSTLLLFNDFQFDGNDPPIQFFDSDRESVFSAVDNYMRGTLVGSLCADRQNKLWAEVGAWVTTNPTGSFLPIQAITDRDWLGTPDVQENLMSSISYLEMGGIDYSGPGSGTFAAYIAAAPGDTPNVRGSAERIQGLALDSLTHLRQMTGNLFANKTAKFPSISMDMAGNYNHLDIAPQETVDVNISEEDTNMGEAIQAPYLVDSVSWNFNPASKVKTPSVGLISLVNGRVGASIPIPEVPNGGGYGGTGGGLNFPGTFPPALLGLNNTQFIFRANTTIPYSAPNSSTVVEMAFNGGIVNYNNTFGMVSGTSSFQTGTYTNQIVIPYAGFYLVSLTTNFENTVASDGASSIIINNIPQQYVPVSADLGYGSTRYISYSQHLLSLVPGQVVGGVATNTQSSCLFSAVLSIILMARLA